MRLFRIFVILFTFTVAVGAQTRKTSTARQRTTQTVKRSTIKKKTSSAKGKKTVTKKASGSKTSIKGLQNESARIKKQIKQHEQRLRSNERDVRQRLQNLMVINNEIEDNRKTIDTIRRDITTLDGNIMMFGKQLEELEAELADRKDKYVKSMRYMHRNSSIQNQLMFVFSAKNFTQMYRRLRFTREYAAYQRAQGEMVKTKREEVTAKYNQLTAAKRQKSVLLDKGEQERRNLENRQTEQKQMVSTLQKQQKTIQQIIEQQRKKDIALNEQIDRLIAEEVERARARAEAEARRRAEAEAAAKRRAEEQARRQVERRSTESTTAQRKTSGKKTTGKSSERVETTSRKPSGEIFHISSEDRRISGGFESNRGRLPMPITGAYRIVSRFGQYNVDGLRNVRLDNKGINIEGKAGAQARSIFDGEVSAVFSFGGITGVMVRHGSYISVYCNLSSVSVHKGQKVTTRQILGTVGPDHILQFQLRREKAKLNPEVWLGKN
ncbi:murein hydrolase activator EnvC family protein [Xylanibacter rodentium]|jgi:septal ring factor EnvC (AmiA/AmiB activator)|uniref:Peptidoglycan DD-metalloendopeptidase family protein n=1 Tax=Xylanibacter rodentium TaxID=2736289 RepID=A0ABX2AXJ1_9BACT|nr:peptidoglycan DD-metalloendopeptidase family protein [Xylanibacter rodentium]NPE10803.1 peptidoglycan DD-metalloendopeptidase family protein [Prevotella sp. PJ1A]NPE14403.1 peptidoglycan DD-metalloendopeptidase family protein [Xylanibacter rodentium]NPE38025.1 peptidoglycan DD-metalloendopeptidase family protein [Prevotella sp. PCJ2]